MKVRSSLGLLVSIFLMRRLESLLSRETMIVGILEVL